jgi:hypothetical protein
MLRAESAVGMSAVSCSAKARKPRVNANSSTKTSTRCKQFVATRRIRRMRDSPMPIGDGRYWMGQRGCDRGRKERTWFATREELLCRPRG